MGRSLEKARRRGGTEMAMLLTIDVTEEDLGRPENLSRRYLDGLEKLSQIISCK